MDINDKADESPWEDSLSGPVGEPSAGQVQEREAIENFAREPLPHPHFGWSILWVFAFWAMQVMAGLVGVALVLLTALAGGREARLIDALNPDNSARTMILTGTFLTVVFALVVAYAFYRRDAKRRLGLRRLNWRQLLIATSLVLPMSIIASEAANFAAEFLPQFGLAILEDFSANPWPIVLIGACLFPAVGEEIFCRGFLGRGLVANHGAIRGVLLTSMLFGIMHVDPVQATGAFALALGMHFAFLMTSSLTAAIWIHLLNNAFSFLLIRNYREYPIPGLTPLPDGTMVHTPPLLLAAAVLACACVCALLFRTRTKWILPDDREWSPGYATGETPPAKFRATPASGNAGWLLVLVTAAAYAVLMGTMWLAYRSALN